MKFGNFSSVESYLYSRVKFGGDAHRGEMGMKRMGKVMGALGNPQDKLKVVHVAGTSGKGSVVFYVTHFLKEHGYKIGSMISPHLVDVRERTQIDGEVLGRHKYVEYFNEYVRILSKGQELLFKSMTYLEILVSFSYFVFEKEGVDFAVVETGMGGLLDYTNVAKSLDKVCVITRIGMDHMHVLGDTLSEIAEQKAGIIHEKNLVVALRQSDEINEVFKNSVEQKNAKIIWVEDEDIESVDSLEFKSKALYQRENAAIAIKALQVLSHENEFKIESIKIEKVLSEMDFEGRFSEHDYMGVKVILDGAHNEQKMKALAESVKEEYGKLDVLLAFKKGKQYKKMLMAILPVVERLYVSEIFTGDERFKQMGEHAEDIEKILKSVGFHRYEVVGRPIEAIHKTRKNKKRVILVTGSLYLVSEIYKKIENDEK